VAADAPVILTFDHRVNLDSLRGRFTVQPDIAGCDIGRAFRAATGDACVVHPLDAGNGFRLEHPKAIFAPAREYSFSLSSGVADDAGVVNSIDHSWTFTTAAAPGVRTTEPEDGARAVPLDAILAVTFSRNMRESSTIPAVGLQPEVAGTRVVRNQRDHSRFVVQPGRLLQPGVTYRLVVGMGATDEQGQPLTRGAEARFLAGGLRPLEHAVILARRAGEGASEVRMTPISPPPPGEESPMVTLLEAPRCDAPACGSRERGAPLTAYVTAGLSPDGTLLAVVERDSSAAESPPTLRVVDLLRARTVAVVPGATDASWSPDGRLLELAVAGEIRFITAAGAPISVLPPGPPLTGRPRWSPDGESLILPTAPADGQAQLELANPRLGARYPVPGLTGDATEPALSPSGRLLAVHRPPDRERGAIAEIFDLASGRYGPRWQGNFQPVGFLDETTLLAIEDPASPAAQLVRLGVSSAESARLSMGEGALPATTSISRGRGVMGFIARSDHDALEAFVATGRGGARRQISFLSRDGLAATALSLN